MSDRDAFEARSRAVAHAALTELRDQLVELRPHTVRARVGRVQAVADGIAVVEGLHRPFAGELIEIAGIPAIAEDLADPLSRVVLLGPTEGIEAGDSARRRGHPIEIPAGPELIGRVVDPLGRPLDGRGPAPTRRRMRAEGSNVLLAEREPVTRPLRTGVFGVDTMIPIGLGQRQLVIGDRSTGKTELCLDILAALDHDTIGIYVAIGRRGSEVAAHVEWLRRAGLLEHGLCVVTDADDPVGLVELAPYAATAMAEALTDQGRDVVIVYDDLTTHAHAHRSLALLMGRPVGREAHPVDIFYAHARLLERATQLGSSRGGGSLTAFPIIETQAGDLTGYIPTNLVSITDGQIRLDATLAAADLLPAIDVALSVSRVGSKAQPPVIRRLAGRFKNRYAQFLELESFARFGTRLEPSAQAVVDWGRRVRRALRQARGVSRSWHDTMARLLVVQADGLSKIALAGIDGWLDHACQQLQRAPAFARLGQGSAAADDEALDACRLVATQLVAARDEGGPR